MATKKPFYILTILFSSLVLTACTSTDQPSDNYLNINRPSTNSASSPSGSISPAPYTSDMIAINTDKGQIVVKLYADQAPKTVANFLFKAKNNFYQNLIFHRVEPGFVIQGGDPLGDGTGGGQIASEINQIPFKEGSVGLARGPDIKISNDSQFFICLTTQACQALTGQYVNFGEVVSGMDVVKKIGLNDKILSVTQDTK